MPFPQTNCRQGRSTVDLQGLSQLNGEKDTPEQIGVLTAWKGGKWLLG